MSLRNIEFQPSKIGVDTEIYMPSNIYRCKIGHHCRIGPFCEIQAGVVVGDRVKIGSHSFICAGCIIEDDVFVGHHVSTCNDKLPRSTIGGRLKGPADWHCQPVVIRKGASIGTGVTLLPGVEIGVWAVVGAGAVVVRSVPEKVVVVGNPAHQIGYIDSEGLYHRLPNVALR